MIVGIDHGYYAIKTKHVSFPSGIIKYDYEPYTIQNVLQYRGRYYVCGTGRQMLVKHGYKLYATGGSSKFLTENGIENTRVLWPSEEAEGGAPKALEMLHNHEIDMVVNIPKNLTSSELSNGYKIRRAAIDLNVPLITNSRLASAFIYAFCTTKLEDIDIKAWGEYK